MDEVKLGEVLI